MGGAKASQLSETCEMMDVIRSTGSLTDKKG